MLWVSALEGYTPHFNIVFSNEPLTRRLFMENKYKVKKIRFFERKQYNSTSIREKMLTNERWEDLVPISVVEYITKIDGINRLRDLNRTDNV